MKLFMIHVGFYDPAMGEGIYEFHTNYFVVATDPKSAKKELMSRDEFKSKQMHIDGIKEINQVDGYDISLNKSNHTNENQTFNYDKSKTL